LNARKFNGEFPPKKGGELKRKGEIRVKGSVRILLALTILVLVIFGCAQITRETRIVCPKCGNLFKTEQGIDKK